MARKLVARYAVAICRDWTELLLAVAALACIPGASQTLNILSPSRLFDDPALLAAASALTPTLRHAIENRRTLTFGQSENAITCTAGTLADQLAHCAQHGTKTFEEALSAWLYAKHAARFDDDIRQGRLLLWVRLFSTEQEVSTCETLLRARAVRVEVHDLVSIFPPRTDSNGISDVGND